MARSVEGGATMGKTTGSGTVEIEEGITDGGGTTGIGEEDCNKESNKEAIRSKEEDEEIGAEWGERLESTRLTTSEEGLD